MKNRKTNKGWIIFWVFAFSLFGGLIVAISNPEEFSVKTFENLSVTQDKKAVEILKECGISKIEEVTHDELLDGEGLYGYRLKTDVGNIFAYFDTEKIRQVRYMSQYLYRNQAVEAVAQDFYVPFEEQNMLNISCTNAIKTLLTDPEGAKFPSITEWQFAKQDGIITISSYVDAKNAFNGTVRNDFEFKVNADDYSPISLVFAGKEYTY